MLLIFAYLYLFPLVFYSEIVVEMYRVESVINNLLIHSYHLAGLLKCVVCSASRFLFVTRLTTERRKLKRCNLVTASLCTSLIKVKDFKKAFFVNFTFASTQPL